MDESLGFDAVVIDSFPKLLPLIVSPFSPDDEVVIKYSVSVVKLDVTSLNLTKSGPLIFVEPIIP